jgi:serine/threonine protein kinase
VDGDTLENQVTTPDNDQARVDDQTRDSQTRDFQTRDFQAPGFPAPDVVVSRRVMAHGELQIGQVLRETYRIIGLLGSGGSGNVFLAAHERIPGQVAVKTLRGELIADEESRARFRAEAQITAGLRHPHIVQILDFDVTPAGVPYLVMELVEGGDLRGIAAAGGQGELSRVAHIVHQIASAVEKAHSMGIVHRDLKPANIMLVNAPGEPDFVKVVDFGLSKLLAAKGPPVTRPDQILGTPGYMAPEQIRGGRIDARVDQFALASMTYELLSGRAPFPGDDLPSVLHAIMIDEPPRLSQLVPWSAAALSEVLARAIAKNPDDRFASVAEFEQAMTTAMVQDRDRDPAGPAPVVASAGSADKLRRAVAGEIGGPPAVSSSATTQVEAPMDGAPADEKAPLASPRKGDSELDMLKQIGRNYRW